jgi:hypothetical protein
LYGKKLYFVSFNIKERMRLSKWTKHLVMKKGVKEFLNLKTK